MSTRNTERSAIVAGWEQHTLRLWGFIRRSILVQIIHGIPLWRILCCRLYLAWSISTKQRPQSADTENLKAATMDCHHRSLEVALKVDLTFIKCALHVLQSPATSVRLPSIRSHFTRTYGHWRWRVLLKAPPQWTSWLVSSTLLSPPTFSWKLESWYRKPRDCSKCSRDFLRISHAQNLYARLRLAPKWSCLASLACKNMSYGLMASLV